MSEQPTELNNRMARARTIIERLQNAGDGTVSKDAAKQLSTLLRGAQRNSALGHDVTALEALEWAS